ncbi:YitT family protein [Listeria ilorinensis]|uniref:YitT family protein n=1 Tax=Listeria ilorinensis TaxID=2867439 RepID=UPI001EF60A83|nr:YitT family protein [Listeria ilorinensis]
MDGTSFKKHGAGILKIALGNAIMALAYAKLMVPHHIINGGVTSIALIFSKLTGLSVPAVTNIASVLILLLCLFVSKELFIKSTISSSFYLLFFNLFASLDFSMTVNIVPDLAIAVICIAFGYYCCLSSGGSAASVDVIALILKKYHPSWNLVLMIRYLNYSVLLLGLFVYGFGSVILGIVFSYAYSKVLSLMLKSHQKRTQQTSK